MHLFQGSNFHNWFRQNPPTVPRGNVITIVYDGCPYPSIIPDRFYYSRKSETTISICHLISRVSFIESFIHEVCINDASTPIPEETLVIVVVNHHQRCLIVTSFKNQNIV